MQRGTQGYMAPELLGLDENDELCPSMGRCLTDLQFRCTTLTYAYAYACDLQRYVQNGPPDTPNRRSTHSL